MLCVLELEIYDKQGLDFFAEDLLLLPSAAASSREESQPKREAPRGCTTLPAWWGCSAPSQQVHKRPGPADRTQRFKAFTLCR
jgi:hypothetical protein